MSGNTCKVCGTFLGYSSEPKVSLCPRHLDSEELSWRTFKCVLCFRKQSVYSTNGNLLPEGWENSAIIDGVQTFICETCLEKDKQEEDPPFPSRNLVHLPLTISEAGALLQLLEKDANSYGDPYKRVPTLLDCVITELRELIES